MIPMTNRPALIFEDVADDTNISRLAIYAPPRAIRFLLQTSRIYCLAREVSGKNGELIKIIIPNKRHIYRKISIKINILLYLFNLFRLP
jgi:hypothetical protein